MDTITRLETILRGEIWTADLPPQRTCGFAGDPGDNALGSEQQRHRPVLILQADFLGESSPTTIIVPVTTQIKHPFLRSHVILDRLCPLRERSMVLCEQLRTIDRRQLGDYVGNLATEDLRDVEFALRFSLGLDGRAE